MKYTNFSEWYAIRESTSKCKECGKTYIMRDDEEDWQMYDGGLCYDCSEGPSNLGGDLSSKSKFGKDLDSSDMSKMQVRSIGRRM